MEPNEQHRLTGQISIRQLFGIVTGMAVVCVILTSLPKHSVFNFSSLLLPTIVYCSARCIGLVFRPAVWFANQSGLFLSLGVLIAWLACSGLGLGWCVLMLPVASFWILQVALLSLVEQMLSDFGFPRRKLWGELTGDGCLVVASLVFAFATLLSVSFGQAYSISGRGSAIDSFWMISHSRWTTHFDCQTGSNELPLTVVTRKGNLVSGRRDADWSFFGLERYKVSVRRGALHVPHWFTLCGFLFYPAVWFLQAAAPKKVPKIA